MLQASLLSSSPESGEITRESLAKHILAEITRTGGPQLPCYQSSEILSGFFDRFGAEDGMAICDQAFAVHGGTWRSAPVTVMRFQESNDGYFAIPLLEESRRQPMTS
jgi:hypothetical protein